MKPETRELNPLTLRLLPGQLRQIDQIAKAKGYATRSKYLRAVLQEQIDQHAIRVVGSGRAEL